MPPAVSLNESTEAEVFLKTRQLLQFRFTFALVGLVMAAALALPGRTDFDWKKVIEVAICVICYTSIGFLFLKARLLKSLTRLKVFNAIMLGCDVIALSALVHFTFGVESDLYVLYLLPILLSSYTFDKPGIYATSLFVSMAYVVLLLIENRGSLSAWADMGQHDGLASAYLYKLWGKILARSAILVSASFIWGGFCGYISGLAHQVTDQLREQLADNQRLVEEVKEQTARQSQINLELRTVQSQLVHQEKMASLGRLVAGIAHELNNPINFVHGNLPYLKAYFADLKTLIAATDDLPEAGRQKFASLKKTLKYDFLLADLENILADLEEGTERIRHIVRNLRSFSRLDEAELKEASINEGLESTLKILGQYYGRDKIPVNCDLAPLPPVTCYPGQLNQLWMNLLSNAAEAVAAVSQPAVSIATRLAQDEVLITIADNGPGIDASVTSKIFEPFFTTKPVGQGTGLGLSICHAIVERHCGKIWFEAAQPVGTIFKVLIPVQARTEHMKGLHASEGTGEVAGQLEQHQRTFDQELRAPS
jgi:signal transduction histidine kinase